MVMKMDKKNNKEILEIFKMQQEAIFKGENSFSKELKDSFELANFLFTNTKAIAIVPKIKASEVREKLKAKDEET